MPKFMDICHFVPSELEGLDYTNFVPRYRITDIGANFRSPNKAMLSTEKQTFLLKYNKIVAMMI